MKLVPQLQRLLNEYAQRCEAQQVPVPQSGIRFLWSIEERESRYRFMLDFRQRARVELLTEGAHAPSADCELVTSAEDALALAEGRLSGQRAFLEGRIQIAGPFAAVIQFNSVLDGLQQGS
ncbi:MAG: SCP2 sterol-binding domain-containing protein [Bdellovibrionales bacterium]|nr:SCP2 sterol-binding domain-containing protein [Bdellovibrionales bacterium]